MRGGSDPHDPSHRYEGGILAEGRNAWRWRDLLADKGFMNRLVEVKKQEHY